MLLTQLNAMSVGPLWVLRTKDHSDKQLSTLSKVVCCSMCGKPWMQPNADVSSVIAVLASPVTDDAQQKLLENCLAAAGWDAQLISYFSLHSACSSDIQKALLALQEQIGMHSPKYIIVFGHATAQLINPDFTEGQINHYANAKLIVTHHPEQMISNPLLKAQVWTDLCLTKLDSK